MNTMYNPAASADFGTYLWVIDEPNTVEAIDKHNAAGLIYLDIATVQYVHALIAAQYEAFLNAPVEDAVQQLDNMFDEVMPCLSSQQL